jgi:drug/metabolite transporter (DMT)-like permease
MNKHAVIFALGAAALFGLSTPVAKLLLEGTDPFILAGLLYLGAGVGIALLQLARYARASTHSEDAAALTWRDAPWLAAAIVAGGIFAPILLMVGLTRTDAASVSLLLTLEGALTALVAWFLFHENIGRRIALGMLAILSGAAVLAWSGAPTPSDLWGPLAVIGACLGWALDNNLTRKVSLADPLATVTWKGLVAGPASIALGLWNGATLPSMPIVAAAMIVGFFGYGLSLVLYILALRDLGTARTAAYFASAPFLGALAALTLGAPLTLSLLAAGALIAFGLWLHVSENHAHAHVHQPEAHAHLHSHDAHHDHDHEDGSGSAPHAHWHTHGRFTHAHAHVPDMHHGHRHS